MKNITVWFLLVCSVFCFAVSGWAKDIKPYQASDFTLQDINQDMFSLSALQGKKPVLLFFWTTWCPFCQKELQIMSDMYPKLYKDGLEVWSIDVGEMPDKVRDTVSSLHLSFRVLLDKDSAVSNSFKLIGVPTYVLVDQNGQVIFQDNFLPSDYKDRLGM
ncbi:MAG TPA: TlpA disulfide reductase family protein [Candidatus Omnitrophota bacterium]|nr:TlpA disulfide reductase family protein [Candidatus Omnitrophota bacterium]